MLVRHSLEVLENWKQCRAGHRLIRMPDGSLVIATPVNQYKVSALVPVFSFVHPLRLSLCSLCV